MIGASVSLLDVQDLTVCYGLVDAVKDLNLRVPSGSIVTIIGSNGAGKTTTLAALMGLIPATGQVLYRNVDIEQLSVADRVTEGITLVPETRELFTEMTVHENLQLGAFQRYRSGERGFRDDFERVYAVFPRLKERQRQLAGTLSGGERQMLAIGRALMSTPKLLMLDEPSLGLAPLVHVEIFRVITRLKDAGMAILLVEQNARAALDVADYAYVLETGQLVCEGPGKMLAADPRVVDAYLGLSQTYDS